MNARVLTIGTMIALLALRAKRAASAVPRAVVTIGRARVIKRPRVGIDIGTARINRSPAPRGGGSGSSAPAPSPMQVAFFVRVSGFEKLGVSRADVKAAVTDNAGVLPGIGRPRVVVRDVSGGFAVTVNYPDSSRLIGSGAATRAIESVDPRLQGRVENVRIVRVP